MGFFVTKEKRKYIDRFGDETTTIDTIVHRRRNRCIT